MVPRANFLFWGACVAAPVIAAMPAAKSFPPEIKRRNRRTLLILLIIVAIGAATPVVVRLATRPIPTVNQTARDLFPPLAGGTSNVTLYGPKEAPLTAAVATMLDRYDAAVQIVFPEAAAPIEIALLPDPVEMKQVWVQIFSRDDRSTHERGIGRSTFVLYDARPSETLTIEQQSGEVAHLIGTALLEQKLEERMRLVDPPYAWLVAEMMSVTLVPSLVDEAWSTYVQLRRNNDPLSERAWLGAFDGEPSLLAAATTRLIAAEFVKSRRRQEFVPLIRDGYDLETAFRALAGGLLTSEAPARGAPPQSVPGTSFDAMIDRIENQMKSRQALIEQSGSR